MSDDDETQTIWKFPLVGLERQPFVEVHMPMFDILSVAEQDGTICVWAEVYLFKGKPQRQTWKKRRFVVHATGSDIPLDGRRYVSTVHLMELGIPIVLHLYELRSS